MGNLLAKLYGRDVKTINSLPVELLRKVLANLDTNPDLLVTREVCTRWRFVAESICHDKRTVIICDVALFDSTKLATRFNNLVDFEQNCAHIKVKTTLSEDLVILLAKLFPNVHNLAVEAALDRTTGNAQNVLYLLGQWSTSITTLKVSLGIIPDSHRTAMSDQLDKLSNLRRLHYSDGELMLNATTFARLQHIHFHVKHTRHILTALGPNCASLDLVGPIKDTIAAGSVQQWAQRNPAMVVRLTHFSFSTFDRRVYQFVCGHFRALLYMDIIFRFRNSLHAEMVAHLALLTRLAHLSLNFVRINLTSLERSNSVRLNSVRCLVLKRFSFYGQRYGDVFSGEQFCRVLAATFPNLEQLSIMTGRSDDHIRSGIAQHLHHFVHLRKFSSK